ncbi:MAG TPA: ectonucleotide pyrophosphatase/phosphodiesterase [Blastocatellia bacterium]|nr:ectonucleotide pyrophosphatase/phosphodiesterase [Blastocatellia bacterium]
MRVNIATRFRHPLLITCLLLTLIASAYEPSKATNALRPTVILISLDGFRDDYLDKFQPPNLLSLARDGVRARWMIPSFPTKTFPNHYTIATGLYPQNNGIVENSVFDKSFNATLTMSNREEVQNGRWWLGEPIWITAEKQGQKSAPLFWPGSEAEIAGSRPTYWKPYDSEMTNRARVDAVLSWLDLPLARRPTLLGLYFSNVDSAGHDFSPDAVETRNAVIAVDKELARLIRGLKRRGIFSRVNLIIVSDHGMATQDPNNTIIIDKLFDTNLAEKVFWTAEIVSIFPKSGSEDAIYAALKAKLPPQAKVYRKSELPARLHYSNSSRIAPLLVLPDEGWSLSTRKRFDERKARGQQNGMRGGHGYDNELPSMRAIFIAHGPGFKKGAVIEPFENIQVYNLMTRILGLKPAPNDGNDALVTAAMAEGPARKP